jgi:3-deoxy-D-manno-octulosonic-acid transferase
LDAKLIFLIYTALQWAASPLILVYFVLRFLRDSRYLGRFAERLGFLPPAFPVANGCASAAAASSRASSRRWLQTPVRRPAWRI